MSPEAAAYMATLVERIAAHPTSAERAANYCRRRPPRTKLVKVAPGYLARLEREVAELRECRAAALAENSQPGGAR